MLRARARRWSALPAILVGVTLPAIADRPHHELGAPPSGSIAELEPSWPGVPEGRRQMLTPSGHPVEVYPPLTRIPFAPVTVMLHGAGASPLAACDFWSAGARATSWLVCPAGNTPRGDGFDWTGSTTERVASVDADLEAVERAFAPYLEHARGDVILGFSRGAFLARDIVYAHPNRYRGAGLFGAAVRPDPARLRAAGIERVLLGAGDLDGSIVALRKSARELNAAGVPTCLISFGARGHSLPPDLEDRLRPALDWLRGADSIAFSCAAASHRTASNDTRPR